MREKERDMELILASGSPRRRELLSLYTTDFTVCVSDFDESTVTADTRASAWRWQRTTRTPWSSAATRWWT